MTRLSKRPKRHGAVYDLMDIEFLLGGPHGCPCAMTSAEAAGDSDAISAAWEALRGMILPDWIRRKPGTRPWAWWKFDAPEQRRTVGGRIHPFDDRVRSRAVASSNRRNAWELAYALHFGMPRVFISPFDDDLQRDFVTNVLHGKPSQCFEEEWSYLVRYNLLLAGDSP